MKRKSSKKSVAKSSEDENGVELEEAEPQTKSSRRSKRSTEQNPEENDQDQKVVIGFLRCFLFKSHQEISIHQYKAGV